MKILSSKDLLFFLGNMLLLICLRLFGCRQGVLFNIRGFSCYFSGFFFFFLLFIWKSELLDCFTIGLRGNFLLVLCFYWLVVYIEVYWILGTGNSFSKFCTIGLFPKLGTWTFLSYYSFLCSIHVECLLRFKCTDL